MSKCTMEPGSKNLLTTVSPLPPTLPPTVFSSESTTPSDTENNVTEYDYPEYIDSSANMSIEDDLGSDEDSKSIRLLNRA